ncbi:muconolactone Delta-isomerase family protein [Pseudonocardia kujensis]|uniref:muconolactone Delta-isomerase n=1 Tax=Pseudonocardia kujensis TaxID=1128675 RepID=UPI001E4EF540|nr:muconolactone Delta-isomerase family protein [Pseudonocardia kujensis]MCE0763227.1 muconolactone Delta-isomerase family protein [Pseudonocardia kujensis]
MADFLVSIDTTDVFALPPATRSDVVDRERAAGRALIEAGTLKGLWRVPGEKGNVGIWSAADADELHDVLQALPIFPHARFHVRPLATHPLASGVDDFFNKP